MSDNIDKDKLEKKRKQYRDRQREYVKRNSVDMICQGCYKRVKKYYYSKHLKSRYHTKYTEKNGLLHLISRIDDLEKRINKIIL